MSRPAPKFAVGEEVLVLSRTENPGEWVECVIVDFEYKSQDHYDKLGKKWPAGWLYWMDNRADYRFSVECNMRKKPRPADQSFDQIMQGLKRPQGVEA
jgi:hypothetical protein